ncbi:MarR family winged helix-turn-helix transcriptional regulator [Methylovulum miyakonense]|uniref:MarR family winged helix-turn-helix transcriptional regulator n=1 Tax=Methylovulum miyakonense TaxID=645578 RepID=UPI00037BA61F|nr:MarR family winged helix-turn-helix transcriptional regulator [Methylovulum miyakonense]
MQDLNTFRLIERISNLLRSEERKKYAAIGLQPVHIQVLDYLSTCNRFSDTPAAVAEYIGLTKGTVSQSIQVLERKDYVTKSQDSSDGRVVHLALSEAGKRLLDEIKPIDVFAQAQAIISSQKFTTIEDALNNVLTELQKANNAKSFGVCHSCVNFIEVENHYLCNLTQLPLSQTDSKKICREHVLVDGTGTSTTPSP